MESCIFRFELRCVIFTNVKAKLSNLNRNDNNPTRHVCLFDKSRQLCTRKPVTVKIIELMMISVPTSPVN